MQLKTEVTKAKALGKNLDSIYLFCFLFQIAFNFLMTSGPKIITSNCLCITHRRGHKRKLKCFSLTLPQAIRRHTSSLSVSGLKARLNQSFKPLHSSIEQCTCDYASFQVQNSD